MVDFRERHSLQAWLQGNALAALVMAVYVVGLRIQLGLNQRLRRLIIQRERVLLKTVSGFGLAGVVVSEQLQAILQGLRSILNWAVLLLISYLLIPLLLGFFPPTRGIASGLQQQLLPLATSLLNGPLDAIPNLLSIAVIIAIAVLVVLLIIVASVVIAFPCIPGSDSKAFQGADCFWVCSRP